MNSTKKYSRQKAHQWQQDLSKLVTLAYLCLESHKVVEEPEAEEQEAEATQMDPLVESEDEDIDMTALAAAVHGTDWGPALSEQCYWCEVRAVAWNLSRADGWSEFGFQKMKLKLESEPNLTLLMVVYILGTNRPQPFLMV